MFFLQPAKTGFMISFEKFYLKKPQTIHENIGIFFHKRSNKKR